MDKRGEIPVKFKALIQKDSNQKENV